MIVDIHTHVIHPDFRLKDINLPESESIVKQNIYDFNGIERVLPLASPEALIRSMNASNISKSAIMGFSWSTDDYCGKENEYIDFCCKTYPQFFYGIGVVQPLAKRHWEKTLDLLEESSHFVGIKLIPFWQGFSLDDPALEPFLRALQRSRLFLMVHVDQGYHLGNRDIPGKFLKVVKKFPGIKWVGAHLGGMLPLYQQLEHLRDTLKNVWYDTALSLTPKFIKYAAESVLPNQLLFGTDYPFNHYVLQEKFLENFNHLQIEQTLKMKILGDNFFQLMSHIKP